MFMHHLPAKVFGLVEEVLLLLGGLERLHLLLQADGLHLVTGPRGRDLGVVGLARVLVLGLRETVEPSGGAGQTGKEEQWHSYLSFNAREKLTRLEPI